ncbi:MAG TPA: hypothetical protein VFX16_11165 [Pseudonocardiaceae bacterium]|nr:hypothetical protein [Pseudonocardiaceae bacterium]
MPVTLRRPSTYTMSLLGLIFVTFVAVFGAVIVPSASRLIDQILVVTVVWLVGWFVWLTGVKPRIVVGEAGLVVVGWFVRWDIAWSAVRSVTGGRALVITLDDGQEIAPTVAGGSMISTVTRNVTQRRMLAVIEARRPAAAEPADTPVRRRIDVQAIPFLAVFVVLIVVTVTVYRTTGR